MLEVPHSPTEATVEDEEYFDLSLVSLESDCERMKLNQSYESIESEESLETEMALENLREEGPADSPGSPDENLSSEIFIVEHAAYEESVTSIRVLEYLEQVQPEDYSSYFITPPGIPRRISFQPVSLLNDLEKEYKRTLLHRFLSLNCELRAVPTLPQEWPCHSPLPVRLRIGRGHGGNLRFPKSYFNW